MKNSRLRFCLLYVPVLLLALFFSSCSGPKQVFYFQNAPVVPKVGAKPQPQDPVYTASIGKGVGETVPAVSNEIKTAAITKKELRKLIRQQTRLMKDSVSGRSESRKVSISGDKQKLRELKSEVEGLKKSVRVESNEEKVVLNYREPSTNLSDTAKILLAVGALIVLVALFSIPVIGPLLAAILAVAVVVAALAIILGYVEIHSN